MKRLSTLFFFAFLYFIGHGQMPGVQWQLSAPSHDQDVYSSTVFVTPDSGILVGTNKLTKLNKNGHVIWQLLPHNQTASITHIRAGEDKYLYAFGNVDSASNNDILVIKFSSTGVLQWERKIGGPKNEFLKAVTKLNDGNWVLAGNRHDSAEGTPLTSPNAYDDVDRQAWVMKVDMTGNTVWDKSFDGSGTDVIEMCDVVEGDNLLVAFASNSTDGDFPNASGVFFKPWIARLNNLGHVVWKRPDNDWAKYTLTKPSGRQVLLGETYGDSLGQNKFFLKEINATGDTAWRRVYSLVEGFHNISWSKLVNVSPNRHVFSVNAQVGSFYYGYQNPDASILCVDSLGALVWQKTFVGDEWEGISIATDNKGVISACVNSSSSNGDFMRGYAFQSGFPVGDSWFVALDSNGLMLFKKPIGGHGDDFGTIYASGDQVFLVGGSNSFRYLPDFEYDLWIAKLGPSNVIQVAAFNDVNSNGVKDTNESFSEDVFFTTATGTDTVSFQMLASKRFIAHVDTGGYVVTAASKSPYYTITPAFQSTHFATHFNTDSFSFALQPIPNKQDLQINILPITPARPGFETDYRLLYKNKGTTIINTGSVILKKDSRLSFVSSSPTPSYNTSDSLRWHFGPLNPNDSTSISIRMRVAAPPTVNNGDSLILRSFIDPVAGDETPADDTAYLKQRVVGSFDPNDKTETNGGLIEPSFVQKGLHLQYLIRFQNTGTDTAFTIIVRDTLDNRVDVSSFEMLSASHPFSLSVDEGKILTWRFHNINLVDSFTNEIGSHGFIAYRIKPLSTVVAGDRIHNTASIYFDYNLPILTNNALTLVRAPIMVLPQGLLHFSGSRSGQNVQLVWKLADGYSFSKFEVERSIDRINFKPVGILLSTTGKTNYSFTDANAPQGTIAYRLRMNHASGRESISNVLRLRGDDDLNNELIVYPNPASQQTQVSLFSTIEGLATLTLINAEGRIMISRQAPVQKGANAFWLNGLATVGKGTYVLKVTSNGAEKTTRLAVQ